ncbi:MAG: type II secretion system protein [Patescibacteria group bacterium]|nr:type II secretion system protein [Patescibacteria group bacterium]
MSKTNKGFTLIELLVVIVIIGILATLTTVALSTARVKARDAKRISDIKQMQTALELYYNEENTYPPTSALDVGKALVGAQSGKTFMGKIPAGPNTGETYTYAQINSGTSYALGYVLEKPVNELAAGAAIALPGSINNQCMPNCIGKYCGDGDGCGGKCIAIPILTSGSLTCDLSTYQLKCGTTVVADYTKINQCSVNTASCSGSTCSGVQVCISGTCQDPCVTNTDCGSCKKCSSGFCVNQVAEDLKSECGTNICYNDSCCTPAACGGATGLCSGQTTCGITCNTPCDSCCKSDNYCGTVRSFNISGCSASCINSNTIGRSGSCFSGACNFGTVNYSCLGCQLKSTQLNSGTNGCGNSLNNYNFVCNNECN